METKDLMINDWVMYENEPIMVWEIDEYHDRINTEPDGYNAITCVEISEVTPVPLTAEILKKNGFHESTLRDERWIYQDIVLTKVDDSYLLNFNIGIRSRICAVHELQHALRLCGIEKEIEL